MIVIPLIQQANYDELRYCLRGIEKQHPKEDVMLVGALPTWAKNIIHLPHQDSRHCEFKARNIFHKIISAFDYCEKMIFFNDDHIIFEPVTYLHHKGLMTTEGRSPNGTYTALLRNTMQQFPGCYDYDTHCPIVYEKEAFLRLKTLNWNKPFGYGIKSSYAAINGLKGEFYQDVKFSRVVGDFKGRKYISTLDGCDLRPLNAVYPNKSKFER